jgi:DNA-binding helix-hairpin-helix protein with protein kinase domain
MRSPSPIARSTVRLCWPDGRTEKARLVAVGKSGGAGEVFSIEGRPDHVAKIYHATIAPAQLAHYERKIGWMIANRPQLPAMPPEHAGIVQLAWPLALVRQGPRFAGFVMEKIDFARTMELDYLLTRRQAQREGFEVDFGKLVTVCYNLSSIIDCLHGKRIAVVDLKPINLKVYKSELYVSILDCDGFHIASDGFTSDAPQVTPDYLAPEFHDREVSHPESQDRFALATIIFRLLNYGIHPYASIAAARQPHPTEIAGRIRLGLYPYGRRANPSIRPAPASVHEAFPESLRTLFDRCFAGAAAGRPSAHEWTQALGSFASKRAGNMSRCTAGHLQFAGRPCPTCLREGILRGHVERRRRLTTRLQATPGRAIAHVRRSLRGTRPTPFQAALAQVQFQPRPLAPATMALRHVVSIEIVWTLGLIVTYWWLK